MMKRSISPALMLLCLIIVLPAFSQADMTPSPSGWQQPPEEIMSVLYAPQLPLTSISPTGEYMMLFDRDPYPGLAEMAAPMHKLAGMRVNPANNNYHGDRGVISPRIMHIESGRVTPLAFSEGLEIQQVLWAADGKRFALTVKYPGHTGLWLGNVDGDLREFEEIELNPLMTSAVQWLPDQKRLLLRRIPERGPLPKPPAIPVGPKIVDGYGASARSTYEARNLLETAYDDKLFSYFAASELVIMDPSDGNMLVIGESRPYVSASASPDGNYILVEYLVGPWSHEVAYWRFAREIEVWDYEGNMVAKIASLALADEVPVHGVPVGKRSVSWRPTAPHTLYWVEALDGGDPKAEVDHRDRLMRLSAPFDTDPEQVFVAEHRILPHLNPWGEEDGLLMLTERERIRRWRYTWLLDVDEGASRKWFDIDEADRYNNPGSPVMKPMSNGYWVLRENDGKVYFRGTGGTDQGDRPFLDRRDLASGATERLFRSEPDKYEYFVAFAADEQHFIMRSESSVDVPNYYLVEIGRKIRAEEGEAVHKLIKESVTDFEDPTPELRQIEKRIVRYKRKDGVPLSFQLHLPPGYKEGERLPTVVYAYPLEYASAETAGQVRGSAQRFMRLYGASHLFFLLQGYAVLDQTAMPMIGDPETTYNTFVEQLVDDAEAAVKKAVEMGVADPDRIGVIGHSHGGLMVANLLAHSDLFTAGIARSGSYNKTMQPFGFQSERRSLFEALDVYIQVSPTFFADQVNEPVLIIHGDDDSNPGTLTIQSEVFFEAVRGAGGTTRMVLLPYEDHGYRAKESIEHVLWEQLRWFDRYLKGE